MNIATAKASAMAGASKRPATEYPSGMALAAVTSASAAAAAALSRSGTIHGLDPGILSVVLSIFLVFVLILSLFYLSTCYQLFTPSLNLYYYVCLIQKYRNEYNDYKRLCCRCCRESRCTSSYNFWRGCSKEVSTLPHTLS
jgi:hypothetical protein